MDHEVIYSSRRTLCIQIKDGRVIVRAPWRYPRTKIDAFVSSHEGWISKKLNEKREKTPIEREYSPDEIAMLKKRARAELIPRAMELSQKSGLSANGFSVSGARTRYGSCSWQNRITLSCFLVLYKQEYIDYVIMHELCHTVHKNHSADFYALLERFIPSCKEVRRHLRNGDHL
ncbi:MAG: DUF45 domain-containing protein [Clostridia bacterium]|nr:DUF45 domain-containing protein [Clostridia bacterium]